MKKEEIKAKIAELLTAGWVTTYESPYFEEFSSMSDMDKRIYTFIENRAMPLKRMVKLYQKEKNIILAEKYLIHTFMRNRFFIKSEYKTLFTITPKRTFCNNPICAANLLYDIMGYLHTHAPQNKTSLRNFVLKGEIPEREDTKIQRILDLFGPTELDNYTTDKNKMVDRIINNNDMQHLIRDMIVQCKALNLKINSDWSDRRLRDQHKIWNDHINKYRHKNCKNDLIWDTSDIVFPDEIELINSEKRCAEEGDNMHHCLYNCYWREIDNKDYMAFHVESDTGDFTVGVIVKTDNTVRIDQAYKAYNKIITEEDQSKLDEVLELAQEIINANIKYDDYDDFHF